jgi:hypothetical protein
MSSTDTTMSEAFDYGASAELFSSRGRSGRRQPLDYRRFASAAEALRFAIEDLAPRFFVGAYLQVEESRYQGAEIRRLYASSHYPLARRTAEDRDLAP